MVGKVRSENNTTFTGSTLSIASLNWFACYLPLNHYIPNSRYITDYLIDNLLFWRQLTSENNQACVSQISVLQEIYMHHYKFKLTSSKLWTSYNPIKIPTNRRWTMNVILLVRFIVTISKLFNVSLKLCHKSYYSAKFQHRWNTQNYLLTC